MERYWGAVEARGQRRAEVAADAVVHALGLVFAVIAGPALVWGAASRGDAVALAGVIVYVVTMTAMFAFSALYNLVPHPDWQETLRRLDHGAIYLKIAGTYTPFAAAPLALGPGKALLAVVWGVAALTLLAAGGALYTVGVAFHLWERLPFQNAIWHLHVLAATACMYAAIAVETV